MIKEYLGLMLIYIQKHKLSAIFWGYILGSVLLKSVSDIDITLSCPIKHFFGVRCYGCGITTATVQMLKFDFVSAWAANPIAFIIVPLLLFIFIRHWLQFVKNTQTKQNT